MTNEEAYRLFNAMRALYPDNPENRDTIKIYARQLTDKEHPLEIRVWSYMAWSEAHYWRAKDALFNASAAFRKKVHGKRYQRSYQLEIDTYTRHWLWAIGCELIKDDQEALEYIMKELRYKPEECKYLPKGMSMYQNVV